MNTPTPSTQLSESNSPDAPRPKVTLKEFIEDNSKLITSMAAFVALTAFALQLDNTDVKP